MTINFFHPNRPKMKMLKINSLLNQQQRWKYIFLLLGEINWTIFIRGVFVYIECINKDTCKYFLFGNVIFIHNLFELQRSNYIHEGNKDIYYCCYQVRLQWPRKKCHLWFICLYLSKMATVHLCTQWIYWTRWLVYVRSIHCK